MTHGTREKLPNRRQNTGYTMYWQGVEISVQVGFADVERRTVREVFLSTRKAGTMIDTACRDLALLISIALQFGCDLDVISAAATRDAEGKPEGLLAFVCKSVKEMLDGN